MTDPELYVHTPDGATAAVGEDGLEAAQTIAACLAKYPWVELRREGVMPVTRWTVMQRNSSGCPVQIAVENWEGDTYLIGNGRRQ